MAADLAALREATRAADAAWRRALAPALALACGPGAAEKGLRSSRSACASLGAVAFAWRHPVGVDVECLQGGPVSDEAMRALALHEEECAADGPAFFDIWVRKEAALKALGVGLALPPRQLLVGSADRAWQAVTSPWGGSVWLRSLAAPAGHVAALALAAQDTVAEAAPSSPPLLLPFTPPSSPST